MFLRFIKAHPDVWLASLISRLYDALFRNKDINFGLVEV